MLVGQAAAQEPASIFAEATAAYQRGQFDSAAIGFTRLAQSGIDDARVWYNLGNAHFKSGHIGAALVSYRRGMRLTPRDPDLIANYRYVRLFAADKIEPVGQLFLEAWWSDAVGQLSISETRWLASLLLWLAVGLSVWRWWPRAVRVRTVPTWFVAFLWAFWLLATGASATAYARDVSRKDGFVIAAQTDVRGGPGNEYALQFTAHDGLEGIVERTEAGWHLVRFPNGLKGWLSSSAFDII